MMHECPPPSSGWNRRRSLSRLNNNNNGVATGAVPPPPCASTMSTSNNHNEDAWTLGSTTTKNYSSSNNSNTKWRQNNHQCWFLLLVSALLLLLGNSFVLFYNISNPDTKSHFSPFALYHYHRRDPASILATFQDDDVSHHNGDDQQQRNAIQKQNNHNIQRGEVDDRVLLEQVNRISNDIGQNLSRSLGKRILVKSCRQVDCLGRIQTRTTKKYQVVVYNSLEQPRFLCGKKMDANSFLVLNHTDPCVQKQQQHVVLSTLYAVLPTRNSHYLNSTTKFSSLVPPIRLGIRGVKPSRPRFLPFRNCDVKCFHLQNNLNTPTIARTVEGTDWEIATSMEGPVYYKSLRQQSSSSSSSSARLPNNNVGTTTSNSQTVTTIPPNRYFATTSLDSDIPLPYFSWDEYAPEGKPSSRIPRVDYDQAIKGAVFMARNCQSTNNREALVQNLIALSQQQQQQRNNSNSTGSSLFRVDSVSRCLHNRDPPPTIIHKDDKSEIMSQYLFYLAFENQNAKDYITEKLWGSLFGSGTVPVYYGAPNIHEHVPPHSIINVLDFPTVQALWDHLVQVAHNRTLYESYQSWRNEPLPESFVRKYNFTHVHSVCRMCRWAFAKKYGWGWNHERQEIEQDTLQQKRTLCWDNTTGLLVHPFRERWLASSFQEINADGATHSMCTTNNHNSHECGRRDHRWGEQTYCEDDRLNHTLKEITHTRSMTLANGSLRRTAWTHDGILDLFLEPIRKVSASSDGSMVLEMKVPILHEDACRNHDASWNVRSHRQFWLQCGDVRLSVLTNKSVLWASPSAGVVQIFIALVEDDLHVPLAADPDEDPTTTTTTTTTSPYAEAGFRMRVIVEQVDAKAGGDERSYFSSIMEDDFFHPMEKFLVLDEPDDS